MMQAYTEEQRKALIVELETEKAVLEKWRDDWNARDKVNYNAICIALAALTAEPVYQVQDDEDQSWHDVEKYIYDDAMAAQHPSRPVYTTPPVAALRLPENWRDLEDMADAVPVAHALGEFLEDATGDNGARVVEAVIGEVKRLNATAPAQEAPTLDYMQGHADALEWAALTVEACHPETSDWLYDDPADLARAIRKGPDLPPATAPAVPNGWKLVPVEPTAAMYDAGDQQLATKQVWDAMLAAAPEVE